MSDIIVRLLGDNANNILAIVGAVYALATAIALLTPTGKDDTWIQKIGGWADRIGLNIKPTKKV